MQAAHLKTMGREREYSLLGEGTVLICPVLPLCSEGNIPTFDRCSNPTISGE